MTDEQGGPVTDEQIAEAIHQHTRNVKAGISSPGFSAKIDDVWVIVSVELSLRQHRPSPEVERLHSIAPNSTKEA